MSEIYKYIDKIREISSEFGESKSIKIKALCDDIENVCKYISNKESLYSKVEKIVEEDMFLDKYKEGEYVYLDAVSRALNISKKEADCLCSKRLSRDLEGVYQIACPICSHVVYAHQELKRDDMLNMGEVLCSNCDNSFGVRDSIIVKCYKKIKEVK